MTGGEPTMPIYEYLCEKCGLEFEREQRISEDPIKTCPECRARRVKRLISQTSFVLKGGGWYSDLYSSSGDSKKEKAEPASSDASSSKKSDDAKAKTPSEKKSKRAEGKSAA
jgi:putative FmdB family regulatory protein